jgi:phenylpropionate dioxygenase-like ring-hydroxylating dioxygenase large terminal subunit
VQERYGLVWICLGDPRSEVPPFPDHDAPGFKTYLAPPVARRCSAARQVENFVDQAHFAWVHEGILGDRNYPEMPHVDVETVGAELRFGWEERPNPVHPLGHLREYRVHIPFTVHLRQLRRGGVECETLFFAVSPSDAKESIGFLAIARNYQMSEEDEGRRRKLTATVQAQDTRIVENQRPEELPFDLAAELHVKGPDAAAIAYRRAMARMGVFVDAPADGVRDATGSRSRAAGRSAPPPVRGRGR